MIEKIKEIVDQFLEDRKKYNSSYKYRLDHSYYIKFQNTVRTDFVRVILGIELPGYERQTSVVYKFSYGPLNDDNEGLEKLIYMQYKEAEEIYKESISVGYNLYKSVLIDNDNLREQIKELEKDLDTWKKASIENHNLYLLEKKRYEEYHDKYIDEKLNHTKTQARIVFAQHILSGNREDRVKDFWNNHKEYVDMYRVNENKY